jgi:hypothetical protein
LAAYERELIGLVKAVHHWRPYLWTRPFVVRTDHYALKFLLDQRLSTIPQHAWPSKLFVYDFSVEYPAGKANTVANALSRRDEDCVMALTLSSPTFTLFDDLHREMIELEDSIRLLEMISKGEAADKWSVINDLTVYSGCIYVPTTSSLWPTIIAMADGAGHEDIQKTLHRLRASFYNINAAKLVKEYVKSCVVYQHNKSEHLHLAGSLQPLELPSAVWADIAMDFIEGFLRVDGKSVILTVVGRFSNYAHFIPLRHPYTAVSVAKVFFDNIVKLHGIPSSIVSDRDPVFTSIVWMKLFRLSGVQLQMSTTFDPQTNSQSKVTNRILGVYLHCLAEDQPRSWLRWLPWAEYCYNTSFQIAL